MRLLCKWAKSNFHGLLSSNSCQKSNGHHGDPRSFGLSLLLCRWLINVIQDHSQTEPESSCVSSVQVQVTTFPNSDPPCVLRSLLPKASEVSVYLLQIQIQPRDPTLFIFPPSNGLKGSFAEFYIFFFWQWLAPLLLEGIRRAGGCVCLRVRDRECMCVCRYVCSCLEADPLVTFWFEVSVRRSQQAQSTEQILQHALCFLGWNLEKSPAL